MLTKYTSNEKNRFIVNGNVIIAGITLSAQDKKAQCKKDPVKKECAKNDSTKKVDQIAEKPALNK